MTGPEAAAQDVLRRFWRSVGSPSRAEMVPFSPPDIASYLGCEVAFRKSIYAGSEEMAGEYSPGLPLLTVATRWPVTVQRFTLAHEIGHHVLHPEVEVAHREPPYFTDEHRTGGRWLAPREREANRFAAELLMPGATFKQAFLERFGQEISIRNLSEGLAFVLLRDTAVPRLRNADPNSLTVEQLALLLVSARRGSRGPIKPLADCFWVSPLAAGIRAQHLGLARA